MTRAVNFIPIYPQSDQEAANDISVISPNFLELFLVIFSESKSLTRNRFFLILISIHNIYGFDDTVGTISCVHTFFYYESFPL